MLAATLYLQLLKLLKAAAGRCAATSADDIHRWGGLCVSLHPRATPNVCPGAVCVFLTMVLLTAGVCWRRQSEGKTHVKYNP